MESKKQEQLWKFWKNGKKEGTFYEVSNTGHIMKHFKNGGMHMCSEYLKQASIRKGFSPILYVKVDGEELRLARIVYEVWHGPIYEGFRIIHKDGNYRNNHQANLKMVTASESGRIGALRQRKGITIYNAATGELYRSTREAAKKTFLSHQTVSSYAKGEVKKPVVTLMYEKDMRRVARTYVRVRERGTSSNASAIEIIASSMTEDEYIRLRENIEALRWDEVAHRYI